VSKVKSPVTYRPIASRSCQRENRAPQQWSGRQCISEA